MRTESVDVLVIGAGPAGAVASAYLNQHKHKVLVLEKEQFPRFVIGESLLPQCMDFLDAVGFIPNVEKHGFQRKTGATFYNGDERLDFEFADQYTKGWTYTWQVKRADFDNILINTAQQQGVDVKFRCEENGLHIAIIPAFNKGTEHVNAKTEVIFVFRLPVYLFS